MSENATDDQGAAKSEVLGDGANKVVSIKPIPSTTASNPKPSIIPPATKLANTVNVPVVSTEKQKPRKLRRRSYFGIFSFLVLVIAPAMAVVFYYAKISSDQFRSEMRFAVRGTTRSPLDSLGLSALPGSSSQGADAYIVIEYIKSEQILRDMREELGLDVRKYFSKKEIDPLYRISPSIPISSFLTYWNWMIAADYNSTTSIATFRVNAFSNNDAAEISEAVLKVSSKLINDLSTDARLTLLTGAQNEVKRTENRLASARNAVRIFRNKEQSLDPAFQAVSGQELITGLQKEILELKARRDALKATISEISPSVRVLDRQISSLQEQLNLQRDAFGSGDSTSQSERNLSDVVNDYSEIKLEEEFAEKAFTSALSSLETSEAEARRQERYFAVLVKPTLPDIALYPLRMVNSLIACFLLFIMWLMVYLGVQAIRDHRV
jgi:capsular polysaccharide transport system permease protein